MNPREALAYAMDLCSRQERCRSEVSEKLASRGLPEEEIGKILDVLVRDNFINESRYASSYAGDKLRLNRWGKIKIRYMLVGRKIPEGMIAAALEGIPEEEYAGVLREELLKKRRATRASSAYELRGKLFRFARQRGFEGELIYRILDEILKGKA